MAAKGIGYRGGLWCHGEGGEHGARGRRHGWHVAGIVLEHQAMGDSREVAGGSAVSLLDRCMACV